MLRSETQPVGDGALGRAIRRLQPEFHDPLSVGLPMAQSARSRRRVGEPIA
jgi:hypothetical protein